MHRMSNRKEVKVIDLHKFKAYLPLKMKNNIYFSSKNYSVACKKVRELIKSNKFITQIEILLIEYFTILCVKSEIRNKTI